MTDELDLAALRRRMVAELSQDQLKAAAIDLGIDWDDLAGETRSMKALSLLDYARRDSRVPELLDWLENKRRAVAGPGDRLFVGVPTLPPHFVGRAELLNALTERLAEGEDLALVGLPGVGKTALAVALAHHPGVLARFPDGVLWASLGPQGDPLRPLQAWAEVLGLDLTPLQEPAARREALKTAIGQKRVLFVIDDVWERDHADLLKCGGPNAGHVTTTRDRGLARAFAGEDGVVTLAELDEVQATTLLARLAPEVYESYPDEVRALARAVGGLPLALDLAGGYLAAPERSLFPDLSEAALAELADPQQRLALATERLGGRGHAETLQASITLSLEGLLALPDGAQAVAAFHALGAFAAKPDTFSREAAEAVALADARTLALLFSRNLLELDDRRRLLLHQTLADVARLHTPAEAAGRHRDYYLALGNRDREDWQTIEAAYGQVRRAWALLPDDDPAVLDYVFAYGHYKLRRGRWQEDIEWAERGLAAARALGRRDDEAALLHNLGFLHDALGHGQEALDYFAASLAVKEALGDREGVATTLNATGAVYRRLGRPQEALATYEQALAAQEEALDPLSFATTLGNIGRVYSMLGRWEEALDYYEHALPVLEDAGDRAGIASTLSNMGAVYETVGRAEEALATYTRALALREEVGDQAGVANTLNNMGMAYDALEQPREALAHYERALAIVEELGHAEGQATTLNNISSIYWGAGDAATAATYLARVLPIQQATGDRYGESITRHNLAWVYRAQDNLPEAIANMQQAVALAEATQNPDVDNYRQALSEMEKAQSKQGRRSGLFGFLRRGGEV